MKRTNLTYVKKTYGVNEKKKFVKCTLQYEINLDKIPGIYALVNMPVFDNLINTMVYKYDIPRYNCDSRGVNSDIGVLVFSTTATATCAPTDTFDVELGKKLSLTRAQKQAFQTAQAFYAELINIIEETFEGVYRLHCGSMESAQKCHIHEYKLTGFIEQKVTE